MNDATGGAAAPGHDVVDLALIAERTVWDVKRHLDELDGAAHELSELLRDLAEPEQADAEVPAGGTLVAPEALPRQRDLLAWQCREELLVLAARVETDESPEPDLSWARTAIARDVTVRAVVVVGSPAAGVPEHLAHLTDRLTCRLLDQAPVSMMVCDDRVALVSDPAAPPSDGATLVQHPGLVAALVGLFETYWQQAADVAAAAGTTGTGSGTTTGAGAGTLDLGGQQLPLLRLLAAGATDDAAARALGVSTRQLVRMVAGLKEQLGATTRLELGARAARAGLV